MSSYLTKDFDFELPKHLIAQQPRSKKEQTPMLVFKNNQIFDKKIVQLVDFFEEGDVMVFNQTKVIKAKLSGRIRRSSQAIGINLNQYSQKSKLIWSALCKPAKKLQSLDIIDFASDFSAEIIAKHADGWIDLNFQCEESDFFAKLENYGTTPLPPYINRDSKIDENDNKNYQTIYAKTGCAVAAPTAGLHFNQEIFTRLEKKGILTTFLNLDVGAGTFLPVKSESIIDHKMHSENFVISDENCEIINSAKKLGKKIIAIGTTSLRALESATDENGELRPQNRSTEIFIYPPYKFRLVDVLFTNFHLPKSTLFMLICAFVGHNAALEIYQHAIAKNYRFFSFGDGSLLFRKFN